MRQTHLFSDGYSVNVGDLNIIAGCFFEAFTSVVFSLFAVAFATLYRNCCECCLACGKFCDSVKIESEGYFCINRIRSNSNVFLISF